jgi:hypothetical protein
MNAEEEEHIYVVVGGKEATRKTKTYVGGSCSGGMR